MAGDEARRDTPGTEPCPVHHRAAVANLALAIMVVATGGLALIGPETFALPRTFAAAPKADFNAFYGASVLLPARDFATLYDFARFGAAAPAAGNLAWLYPPTMLLLIEPLASVPYPAAKAAWLAAIVAAFVAAARACGRTGLKARAALVLTSAPALITVGIVQASAFFLALLVVATSQARTHPILAGLCAGLLTVKPQYGLVLPVFLLAARAYRAVAVAGAAALALAGASALRFGPEAWHAYLTEGLYWGRQLAAGSAYNYHSTTLYQPLDAWGLGAGADFVHGAVVLTVWACVAATARRAPFGLAVGVALIGTGLAAPYFHLYDYAVVLLGALIVARHAPASAFLRIALPALFAFPALCWIAAAFGPLRPVSPALTALGNAVALGALIAAAGPYLRKTVRDSRRRGGVSYPTEPSGQGLGVTP